MAMSVFEDQVEVLERVARHDHLAQVCEQKPNSTEKAYIVFDPFPVSNHPSIAMFVHPLKQAQTRPMQPFLSDGSITLRRLIFGHRPVRSKDDCWWWCPTRGIFALS